MKPDAAQIMILSDDPPMAEQLRCGLEELGYAVFCPTGGGAAALPAVEARRPDLLIVDLDGSGADAASALAERAAGRDPPELPPVLFLGAPADLSRAGRLLKLPASGFLSRPAPDGGDPGGPVQALRPGELAFAVEGALRAAGRLRRMRESEGRYRRLAENARDMIYRMSLPAGRYEYVSPSVQKLTGYPPQDFYRTPFFIRRLLPADWQAYFDGHCSRLLRGEVQPSFEFPIRRRDGKTRWIHQRNVLVRDAEGRPEAIEGICTDITARKGAEEALRRSEELFRSIVETCPGMLFINDADGDTVYASPSCEQLTGYSPQEFLQSRIWLAHPEDLPRTQEAYRRGYELGEDVRNLEYRAVRKDGEVRYFSGSWKMLKDRDGRITGRVSQVLDVTERKKLQEQAAQSSKLEAIGRLAGGIAHDFNNILTTITGCSDLLKRDPQLNEYQASLAGEIHKAAERATDLVRRLLTFSRRQAVCLEVLDLCDRMNGMAAMLRRLIGENIHLAMEPALEPAPVRVDPTQIDQVLLNLVLNARDAMPQGGRLTLRIRRLALPPGSPLLPPDGRDGPYVLLSVTDTGCGMDEDTRRHIFEPFFTTKEPGRGTGLGLATVYGIVHQSGGFLRVVSEPGRGSTFEVYLPSACGADRRASSGQTLQPPP